MYSIIASLCISLVSFVGVVAIPFEKIKKSIPLLVSLAAGGMIGDVFLHMIPHIIEEHSSDLEVVSFSWFIVGIVCFYSLETILHWHHDHNIEDTDKSHHIGSIAVVGDALHNFFDGLGVAAAFAISPGVGFATTIAFIIHEIPQELGDFAIFIHSGWSRKKALLINFLTGLTSVLGAVVGIFLLQVWEQIEIPIVMLTAGSLVYIALADLIPEGNRHNMHHHKSFRFWVLASFVFGVLLMYGLTFVEAALGI
jgi:zinc and cadmium transporter